VDERVLTERLVTYDTSTAEGLHAAAGFVKGWLEARDIEVEAHRFGDLHALTACVGPEGVPTIVFHGHLDIVPGHPEQSRPRAEGDRLYGRGAYDMKGGLAAMMCALRWARSPVSASKPPRDLRRSTRTGDTSQPPA
jgi:succinyl-diaminopimelate desuccinylase